METGKTGKYFKYAIGEIILVVIGILIALSINNWNIKRVENKRVDTFLQKLKVQTENNISNVDASIKKFDGNYQTSLRIIPIIGEKDIQNLDAKIDSLVSVNFVDYHLNLDMNIIIEARENGDLTLLLSDKLRQALYKLSTENIALIERERITNEDLNLLFIPYLNKNYNFRNRTPIKNIGKSKLYKNDNYKLLTDQEFENYIISRVEYNDANVDLYKKMKENLEAISELLLSM